MKKFIFLLFLFLFKLEVNAQEMNEHLSDLLEDTKAALVEYSKKNPNEIYDGRYDETDILMFLRIGFIEGYEIIFPKNEVNVYKVKLVQEISSIFDNSQLEAIVKMGNEPVVDRKKTAKYFEVARLYKSGKLKEKKIIKKL
jgi:hypothetical protein